jgi:hypothetical protein
MATTISGWYYDLQLENRLTCATLHPYSELVNGKWGKFVGGKEKADDDVPEYRKEPICKAIITEDFNVSVANTWSDFGGDMIGQMWESIKPLAPYVSAAKEMIRSAVDEYDKADAATKNKINESTVSRTLANVMKAMNDTFNNENSGLDITDYLNRALVVQGTRFSYYSGSGTSFGNLVMKFTLFPTFNGKKYITVDKQVEKILPYCIGEYVTGADGLKTDEETQKIIDGMIAWQKPPGGFRANVKNVDVIQEGTLMLRFGAYYSITNLVIESANFNFSKQMTKKPDPTLSGEIISPLYCDVTIQLRPATKYSDKSLRKFILSRASTKTVTKVTNEMKKNLLS